MKTRLLEDYYSTTKKGLLYGIQGEAVEITAVFGTVLIVRNKKGNTYPIASNKTDYSHETTPS